MVLEVKDLVAKYGEISVLGGISFTVEDGGLITLIGSNGAGKNILLKITSELLEPAAGSIALDSKEIGGVEADRIVTLGISQCPEERKVFQNQTVYKNLKTGTFTREDDGVGADIENHFNTFLRLGGRHNQPVGSFSSGEQQMLVICRALMVRPRLLLLDEPFMGLAPIVVQEVFNIIKGINIQDISISLVEQSTKQVLKIEDHGYVLGIGNVVASDTAENPLANKAIQEAYLGGA